MFYFLHENNICLYFFFQEIVDKYFLCKIISNVIVLNSGVVKGNLKCYIKLFLYVKFYKFTNLQFT